MKRKEALVILRGAYGFSITTTADAKVSNINARFELKWRKIHGLTKNVEKKKRKWQGFLSFPQNHRVFINLLAK